MPLQTRSSYVTSDDADAYFAGKLNTAGWDGASPEQKTKATIDASTIIDNLAFGGEKLVIQQEHEFPRYGVDRTIEEIVYDDNNIPVILKYAVCEQALAMLEGFDPEKEINSINVNARTFGDVKTHYDRSGIPAHLKCGICALAWQFLLPLLRDPRDIRMVRV